MEQHGPHLPVATDTFILDRVVVETIKRISSSDEVDTMVLILPTVPIGASSEHDYFLGTISVEDDILGALWISMCRAALRVGASRFLIVNSHGGQRPNVDVLVRKLRFDYHVLAVAIHLQSSWGRVPPESQHDEPVISEDDWQLDFHAGIIETSVMLYSHPDLVKVAALADNRPNQFLDLLQPPPNIGPNAISFGWQAQDLNPSGAIGNSRNASAELGQKLLERAVESATQILQLVIGHHPAGSPNADND